MVSKYKQIYHSNVNATFSVDQKLDFLTKGLKIKLLANLKSAAKTGRTMELVPYYYAMTSNSWSFDETSGTETYQLDKIKDGNEFVNTANDNGTFTRTIYLDARLDYNRTFSQVHNVT